MTPTPIDWPTDDHTWWWMRRRRSPQSKWMVVLVERVAWYGETWVQRFPDHELITRAICWCEEAQFVRATPPPEEWQ
ncbi:hypothetical protein LCGC14_0990060 [marine sediment metagenome]|uniref:Uncharacterized protein n=1 Tax=marine sediment metagenome TaxID=412755 RepID=A0A0F9RCP1_9ZZZZ